MCQRAEVAEARASALQARVGQLEQEAPRPGSQEEGRAEGALEAEGGQGQEERRVQVEGQTRAQEESRARLVAAAVALEESQEAEGGLRARLAQVGVWCVCLGGGWTQVEASSPSLPPPCLTSPLPPPSPFSGGAVC